MLVGQQVRPVGVAQSTLHGVHPGRKPLHDLIQVDGRNAPVSQADEIGALMGGTVVPRVERLPTAGLLVQQPSRLSGLETRIDKELRHVETLPVHRLGCLLRVGQGLRQSLTRRLDVIHRTGFGRIHSLPLADSRHQRVFGLRCADGLQKIRGILHHSLQGRHDRNGQTGRIHGLYQRGNGRFQLGFCFSFYGRGFLYGLCQRGTKRTGNFFRHNRLGLIYQALQSLLQVRQVFGSPSHRHRTFVRHGGSHSRSPAVLGLKHVGTPVKGGRISCRTVCLHGQRTDDFTAAKQLHVGSFGRTAGYRDFHLERLACRQFP